MSKKKKNKILLFQAFWTDGQVPCTRTRNILCTANKNLELVSYLRERDIDIEYKVFDFSADRCINEAIHIPYPKGVYKRSEKLNRIFRENSEYDFMFCFDSDAYFDPRDYDAVLEKLKALKDNSVLLFEMASLKEIPSIRIALGDTTVDPFDDYRFSTFTLQEKEGGVPFGIKDGEEGAFGGLGGVFLCSTRLLLEEKFNENFTQWGDEDVEVLARIRDNTDAEIVRNTDIFPFHLFHFRDMFNEDYINPAMRDDRWEMVEV